MKTLTDFRKTVETGIDRRLKFSHNALHILHVRPYNKIVRSHNKVQKKRNPARYQLRYDVYTSLC